MGTFTRLISTVDTHTAGECTRIVTSGLPPIQGATMGEKLAHAAEHLPWAPRFLMLEPRGHKDMFGAVLVPPCDPRAQLGVIFMDNQSYEPMCGHGLIGVVTAALETGMLPHREPVTEVCVDTPAGLVRAEAQLAGGQVSCVSFDNVPAFVYRSDVRLELPDLGEIMVDIAFGGNFFVMVDARQLGFRLAPEEIGQLTELGTRLLDAANAAVAVRHPNLPHIDRVIDLRFYISPGHEGADSRNVVVLGDHMVDRSPCGTGTCAELALRHARSELAVGQPWIVESVLGTRFTGTILAEAQVQGREETFEAVLPRVSGTAYITGFHQFVLDPRDPLPEGFLLR